MEGLWLGLDVGTQGTKGLVLDLGQAQVIARESESYGLIPNLARGAAEQQPQTWWNAIVKVTRRLTEHPSVAAKHIHGMAISAQQHGFVSLDKAGKVIRAAKLWCDTETTAEAKELSRALGVHVPVGFTASKILWMKRHEPELFARMTRFCLPHDWVNLRLTGKLVMEAGDASGTGFFDPLQRCFDREAACAIDPKLVGMLPHLQRPDRAIGRLTKEAATELGLSPDVLVAPGGGDNMMSAIGSGATEKGVVVVSLGTSGTIFSYSDVPVVDPDGLIAPFCDSTGAWLPLLCVMNLTGVLEELRAAFGMNYEELTQAAEAVEAGAKGALFIPYLNGERTPDLPHATGTLLGLRPGSMNPGVLFRAALEGTSASLAWGMDRLRALGVEVNGVRVVGGGASNTLWCKILAAFFGVPVQRLNEEQSGALGAALQAAWVTLREAGSDIDLGGLTPSVIDRDGPPLVPPPALVECYQQKSEEFRSAVARIYL